MENIILIVDDNPELIDGVKISLEMEGYQVLSAKNGKEALEMLNRITPDLILTDIMMPEMDGYEFYERVHANEKWVKVPFIFLTAKTDQEDIRRGKAMGVDDYITKPFDPEDMIAVIRGRMKRMSEVIGPEAKPSFWSQPRGIATALGAALLVLFLAWFFITPILTASSSNQGGEPRTDLGEMISIPAGEFTMGDSSTGGQQTLNLAQFEIDKYEVVNAQYKKFVDETNHKAPWGTYPEQQADFPVTGITWEDAQAYCNWAGKRLPAETEWEKAARGEDARIYPWGNEWRSELANTQEDGPSLRAVGSYEAGVSPYGVHDMAGNVAEWVDDWFSADQSAKVIRGGSANAVKKWAQTFSRNQAPPTFQLDTLGFRCAN